MSRIADTFGALKAQGRPGLVTYITAGDPSLARTRDLLRLLPRAGADVIELGDRNSGRNFFYRLSESRFHLPLSRTDMMVIHEVTNGPFDRERTIFAPFAPAEDQADQARKYMREVTAAVAQFAGFRGKIPGAR